jgi:hypothetical protein
MNEEDRKRLHRHRLATIGLFVTFWIFTLAVVFLIEFIPISETAQKSLMGVVGSQKHASNIH